MASLPWAEETRDPVASLACRRDKESSDKLSFDRSVKESSEKSALVRRDKELSCKESSDESSG